MYSKWDCLFYDQSFEKIGSDKAQDLATKWLDVLRLGIDNINLDSTIFNDIDTRLIALLNAVTRWYPEVDLRYLWMQTYECLADAGSSEITTDQRTRYREESVRYANLLLDGPHHLDALEIIARGSFERAFPIGEPNSTLTDLQAIEEFSYGLKIYEQFANDSRSCITFIDVEIERCSLVLRTLDSTSPVTDQFAFINALHGLKMLEDPSPKGAWPRYTLHSNWGHNLTLWLTDAGLFENAYQVGSEALRVCREALWQTNAATSISDSLPSCLDALCRCLFAMEHNTEALRLGWELIDLFIANPVERPKLSSIRRDYGLMLFSRLEFLKYFDEQIREMESRPSDVAIVQELIACLEVEYDAAFVAVENWRYDNRHLLIEPIDKKRREDALALFEHGDALARQGEWEQALSCYGQAAHDLKIAIESWSNRIDEEYKSGPGMYGIRYVDPVHYAQGKPKSKKK